MFQEHSFEERFEDIQTLIRRYKRLQNGEANDYLDEESFLQIIEYFEDEGNLKEAVIAADTGIKQFPYSADLLVGKGALLNAFGKFDEALEVLDHAFLLNPQDFNQCVHRIESYLGLGDDDTASKLLQENFESFEGDDLADFLLEAADIFSDWKNYDRALDCLLFLLEKKETNQDALQQIHLYVDVTGRIEESIKLHKRIIDNHPYSSWAWYNLGAAFLLIKLYEKAEEAFQFAIAINDHFELAWRNLADTFIRLHQYQKAIQTIEECIELVGDESMLNEALGYCHEKQKNYVKSRFYYQKALGALKEDDNIFFRIGKTYMKEKQWKKAIPYLSVACKLSRHHLDYFLSLGDCYLQLEDPDNAITFFMEAVQLRPYSKRAQLAAIRALYFAGYLENALEQLEVAEYEITGTFPELPYYRFVLLYHLGKRKEAFFHLESAIIEAPKKLKALLRFDPTLLQDNQVLALLAKHKEDQS